MEKKRRMILFTYSRRMVLVTTKKEKNIGMKAGFKTLIEITSLIILFPILELSCRQTAAPAFSIGSNEGRIRENKLDDSVMEKEVYIQANSVHGSFKWRKRISGKLAEYLLHLHEFPNGHHAPHGKIRILTGYPFAEFHVGKTIYKWEGNDVLINELTDMEYPFPYGNINTMEENDHDIPPVLSRHLSSGRLKSLRIIEEAYTAVLHFWEDKYRHGIY